MALAAGLLCAAGARAQSAEEVRERASVRKIYDRIAAAQSALPAGASSAKPGPYKLTIPGTTVTYEMVPVPAGEFSMGAPAGDPRAKKDEQPQHKVSWMPSGCRRTR